MAYMNFGKSTISSKIDKQFLWLLTNLPSDY